MSHPSEEIFNIKTWPMAGNGFVCRICSATTTDKKNHLNWHMFLVNELARMQG